MRVKLTAASSLPPALRAAPTSTAASRRRRNHQKSSVRGHMEFLASDAMNGRGSGTRDEWIAATYVASQLRRLGLEPMGDDGGYVQTIAIERPELGAPPVLSIGDRRFTHGEEITVAAMTTPRLSGALARHQTGVRRSPGNRRAAAGVDARARTDSVAPAAMVLTRPNGCAGSAAQAGRAAPRRAAHARRSGRVRRAPPASPSMPHATPRWRARRPASTVTLEGEVKNVAEVEHLERRRAASGSGPQLGQEVILLSAHIDHVGGHRPPAAGAGRPRCRQHLQWRGR